MKTSLHFLLAGILAIAASFSFAQSQPSERFIRVTGTAEMEIVPDEIYVSITLSESYKDKKKTSIEELEKGLLNYLTKVTSVKQADIKMDNVDAEIVKKRRSKEEVISKMYDVKFSMHQQVQKLYSVMDSLGIVYAGVRKYSHSKMDEFKKQVRINAIKAAKEKASYLLEAIGSKAGKPVSISERSGTIRVDAFYLDEAEIMNSYTRFRGDSLGVSGGWHSPGNIEPQASDKTIKLVYEIDASFEILP
jgi:uncharacterized protein